MDHQFTVLTFTQQITTQGTVTQAIGQAPWSNLLDGGAIPLAGATLSTITVTDDDNAFQSGRYNPDSAGQTLVAPVTFGNDPSPTPAGTALSFHIHSVIQTRNADGTPDTFLAFFPRQLVPYTFGMELGDRHSVMLMPVARPDGTFPVFSLAKTYSVGRVPEFGRDSDAIAYAPPAAVTCFAKGTMIDTAEGLRPVETLRPGDRVITRDRGVQVLRWQGGTHVLAEGLETRPNLRPILIRKGALGPGCPSRDLVVSPQHRILVGSRIAHRLFRDAEILVAAKHLVGLPGIGVTVPPEGVTYVHLLFNRHEIVMSNGAWSESLYTGPEALKSVSDAARREIAALFPELVRGTDTAPVPARRLLTGREAQQLAERQRRNIGRRSLVEAL